MLCQCHGRLGPSFIISKTEFMPSLSSVKDREQWNQSSLKCQRGSIIFHSLIMSLIWLDQTGDVRAGGLYWQVNEKWGKHHCVRISAGICAGSVAGGYCAGRSDGWRIVMLWVHGWHLFEELHFFFVSGCMQSPEREAWPTLLWWKYVFHSLICVVRKNKTTVDVIECQFFHWVEHSQIVVLN